MFLLYSTESVMKYVDMKFAHVTANTPALTILHSSEHLPNLKSAMHTNYSDETKKSHNNYTVLIIYK